MLATVIYNYNGDGALPIDGCVMALGFFDGVHVAHRDLISKAKDISNKQGLPLGVFTFPAENGLKPGAKRLYSTDERNEIFESLGVDFTVLVEFSAVSSLTPEKFVKNVLIESFKCKVAVIGFNFRFGKGALGDANTLQSLMAKHGGECIVREEYNIQGVTICTTFIRELLSCGELEKANELLIVPFHANGIVERGNGVGKGLGFPTINTPIEEWRVNLRRGVYHTAVAIGDKLYNAITNVGICPTFDARKIHAETYILGFNGDLYGQRTKVYFLEFIRDEMRFSSEEQLKKQINIDINKIISKNGEITWQELGLK